MTQEQLDWLFENKLRRKVFIFMQGADYDWASVKEPINYLDRPYVWFRYHDLRRFGIEMEEWRNY